MSPIKKALITGISLHALRASQIRFLFALALPIQAELDDAQQNY
jgi:hypothetical protein